MSSNVSFGGCGSVCAHAAINLLSTRDVSRVISFTRPSSRLTFSGKGATARGRPGYEGKGATAREDGLGTRVKGRQRERTAWVRG